MIACSRKKTMFRASHFKSQNVPMKQIPTTWFGPKILKTLAVASQLRLWPGFSSSYAPQGKSQIYLLHGMVWRYIFPSHSHSMFDTQKRCMFDTPKNRKKSEKIYRIQGTARFATAARCWSNSLIWPWLSAWPHDSACKIWKTSSSWPKKTAKKGMNFVNPGKIQIFGRSLFELLVFFWVRLRLSPNALDSFK